MSEQTTTAEQLVEHPVSRYQSATDNKGNPIALAEILDGIQCGFWEKEVATIRQALAAGETEKAEALKTALQGFTVSGTFAPTRKKTNLAQASGLLIIDIDKLSTTSKAVAIRDQLGNDPHALAAFVSPSGLGVKAIFYIETCKNDAEAKAAWRALADYLAKTYALAVDVSGKDVCRLCFVSHDPGAVIKTGAVRPFTARAEVPKPSTTVDKPTSERQAPRPSNAPDAAVIRSAVAVLDAGCSRADWLAIGCAIKNAVGDSGFQIFDSWSATAPGKYSAGETRKLWDTIAADAPGGVTVGTLFKLAENAGWINPTGRLALGIRRAQAAEQAQPEPVEKVEPQPLKPWQTVEAHHVREAIAGSPLAAMVEVLQAVTIPPLPLEITLPKALALAGTALSQPVDFDPKTETRRGLDLARVVIATSGGQACNVWTVIVAPSGTGKDIGYLPTRIAHKAGMALGHSGSAEGLADALVSNGAGLLTLSELQNYLNPHRWEHSATSFLTQSFNIGHAFVALSRRNGGSRDIRYCCPSILANVQEEVIANVSDRLLLDSGFFPRFLVSHYPATQSWRPNTADVNLAPLQNAFDLYRQIRARVTVPQDYLQDVLDEFVQHGASIPSHYNRLVNEYGARFAVMLATNPLRLHSIEITADHWRRAGILVRWFYVMAERVLCRIGETRHVRTMEERLGRMLDFIQKHPRGVDKPTFSRVFHRGSTAEERDKDIRELADRGAILIATEGRRTILMGTK